MDGGVRLGYRSDDKRKGLTHPPKFAPTNWGFFGWEGQNTLMAIAGKLHSKTRATYLP